eukprot:s3589_g7.t1
MCFPAFSVPLQLGSRVFVQNSADPAMLLEEVPIAVDSFNHPGPEQGGPQIFFCSHAHDDHLRGLGKKWRKGRLFASEITSRLLKLRWPQLEVTVLQMEQVHTISLKAGLEIQVYLIDANHVPGSVMFLFSGSSERYFGSVLYTGDFRLHSQHSEICTLQMLRDKELSRIYLDNTYCDPRFCQPPRAEVTKAILRRLKKKWPCIVFMTSYKLGKEELLLHLCHRLRTKLIVSDERCRTLQASEAFGPELEKLVQRQNGDPAKWPEELLYRESLTGCIWLVSRANMRKAMLRASDSGAAAHGVQATGWAEQVRKDQRPSFEDDEHCLISDDGICSFSYSDHSSYLELVQFLQFLPAVPVTFLTPLRHVESEFSYDTHNGSLSVCSRVFWSEGNAGMFQLLKDTGVPSIRHYDKGGQGGRMDHYRTNGGNGLAPKRGHPEKDPLEGSGAENGGAAIALSLAVMKWPWNYLGGGSRTQLTQLRAVSRQQSFQTMTRPVFDGLEDLEEEEEEELEDPSTVPKERSMVSRPIGTGLQILEDLYSKHRGSKDPPEIDDEELEDLHAMLKEELPRCPSISSVAFAAKVLEDLEIEDDDVFEVIATEVKTRADELEPQETLDIVLSFGAIYFNDDELLAALVGAIRRQLQFFTNAEIVRLANAMSRLGGLDDSKHVGMFFEMRSRVNMPLIDKAIRSHTPWVTIDFAKLNYPPPRSFAVRMQGVRNYRCWTK